MHTETCTCQRMLVGLPAHQQHLLQALLHLCHKSACHHSAPNHRLLHPPRPPTCSFFSRLSCSAPLPQLSMPTPVLHNDCPPPAASSPGSPGP